MNELFAQGGKGSVGIQTNKQAIARLFGIKHSEVVYFKVGTLLSGYRAVYDPNTQRAYFLPALATGTTAVNLTVDGVLTHSSGNVDLAALAVERGEYTIVVGSFTEGATVTAKNDVLRHTNGLYRWMGALPKVIGANSTPALSGGMGIDAWVLVGNSLTPKSEAVDYVQVTRPSGNQLISAGADAVLIFTDTPNINLLERYNTNNGQYTAPYSGMYRVSVNAQFYNVTAGQINVKVGSVTHGVIPIVMANSIPLANGSVDVYLAAGAIMTVTANVVGTDAALVAGNVSKVTISKL